MLGLLLLVSAAALVLRRSAAPVYAPVLVFTTGLLLVALVSRLYRTPTAALVVVLGAYGLHSISAAALWGISAWGLPILSEYQMGQGFWMFAPDAATYHKSALSMLASWQQGTEFTLPNAGVTFQVYSGLVYRVIGPSPLGLVLLNSWYAALTALVAYRIVARITTARRSGILAAGLVGFWPSSVLWSSTIVKDPLLLLLEVGVIVLLISLVGRCRTGATSRGWGEHARFAGALLLFCVLLFLITKLRGYAGHILIFGTGMVFAVLAIGAVARRAWAHAGQATLAILLLMITVLAADWVNLLALVAPRPRNTPSLQAETADRGPLVASSAQPSLWGILTSRPWSFLQSPLARIVRLRVGFLRSGGTLVGTGAILLYPPPWRWAEFLTGSVHAKLYLLEAMLVLVLLPFVLGGVVWCFRKRQWDGLLLVFLAILFLVPLSLVVANYGTFFRLRLQFLIPLLMVAAMGAGVLLPSLRPACRGETRETPLVEPRGAARRP